MSTIVDLEHTSQLARVLAFADARREQARREAAQIAMLTDAYEEVMDGPHVLDETAYASLYAVFAVEARMTDFQIGELMSIGHSLRQAFTLTGEAFTEGELSLAHVRAILEPAESIKNDPVLVPFYEAQIVEYAKTTTPACARARAKQVVASLDPQTTQELHRAARETRTVRTVECENGMSELIVRGPTPLVNGAYDLLTRQAKGFEEFAADGDTRTLDNIRYAKRNRTRAKAHPHGGGNDMATSQHGGFFARLINLIFGDANTTSTPSLKRFDEGNHYFYEAGGRSAGGGYVSPSGNGYANSNRGEQDGHEDEYFGRA